MASSCATRRRRWPRSSAAACLGYIVENPGLPALDLKFEDRLVVGVLRRIEARRADTLLCPWERDVHHDHEVVSRIAVSATRRVPRVLMGQINYYLRDLFRPNVFVDITATWPKKIEALQCYNKQWERDAYGDLQNGNVIINRRPCLIDYDGVYVPGLSVGQGTELGHKHFQHPKRSTAAFGPEMDRFSFIVIDLSLNALIEQPSLFSKYSNGENIIFTASDFNDPSQSQLFQELFSGAKLKTHALHFARICTAPIKEVPLFSDFLAGRNIASQAIVIPAPVKRHGSFPAAYIGAFDVVPSILLRLSGASEIASSLLDR
jgi:hypothetical protein